MNTEIQGLKKELLYINFYFYKYINFNKKIFKII